MSLGRVNFAPTAGTAHFAATAQATLIAPQAGPGNPSVSLDFSLSPSLSLSRSLSCEEGAM